MKRSGQRLIEDKRDNVGFAPPALVRPSTTLSSATQKAMS